MVTFLQAGWLRVALGVVALLTALSAVPAQAQTRSLKLYFLHTGEKATITYKRNGKFIDSGLKEINQFLRDWRRNEPTKMDPNLLDLIWEVYKESGSRDYIHVISAYRSPSTNSMLRKRGRGVASKSQHVLGKALDFYLPDVKLSKLRKIGLRKQLGGVGYYPKSGSPFVHMDTGRVRHWPRMNRRQLVAVFPNGKTLHVPSDGKPLPGFKQAQANYANKIKNRKNIQIVKAEQPKKPGLLQRILGGDEEEDQIANQTPAPRPVRTVTQPSEETQVAAAPLLSIPIPIQAPRTLDSGSGIQIVSAEDAEPEPIEESPEDLPTEEVAFAVPVPSRRPEGTPVEDTLVVAKNDSETANGTQSAGEGEPDTATQLAELTTAPETEPEAAASEPSGQIAETPEETSELALAQSEPVTVGEPAAEGTPVPVRGPTVRVASLSASEIQDLRQQIYAQLEETGAQGDETVTEASEPIEPGTRATDEISVPTPKPADAEIEEVQVASLDPIEPGTSSTGDIALPSVNPERETEVEAPLVTASLQPIEPGAASTGETAIPAPNPGTRLTAETQESEAPITVASIPVPQPNPISIQLASLAKPEAPATARSSTSGSASGQVELAARTISLEEFSMPDLNTNTIGKWALAADTSIERIADIRLPAYGRNAIRQLPSSVPTNGFATSRGDRPSGEFVKTETRIPTFIRFGPKT